MKLLSALLSVLLPSLGAVAQEAREFAGPTTTYAYVAATPTTIGNTVALGQRIVSMHFTGFSSSTPTFDVTFVANSGAYAQGWWWYYGLTAAQVTANLTANHARLTELEPYDDGAGNTRFACVMVDNTGANAKSWWWLYNTDSTAIANLIGANNARIVSTKNYTIGGTAHRSAVFVANAGADARSWWYYFNVTGAQVASHTSTNNARLWCLNPLAIGNFDCVMIRDVTPTTWYWWYGLTASDVLYYILDYGVRPIDLRAYGSGASTRYAMVTLNNSNPLETTVGDLMRADTNGQVGAWLQQINGSNYASLNGNTSFEPASGIKVLIHTHAMRQLLTNPNLTLQTLLTVYTGTVGSCPQDTGPVNEPLQTVLELMMRNSDNNRTQACQAFFGRTNINNTAAALGMTSTGIHHRLGCAADALANPDTITLHDLHRLHTQVANGYLGGWRDTFYDIMLHSVNDLGLAGVIDQEAAAIGGLSAATIASFKGFTKIAHKGGSYGFTVNGTSWYDRSEFAWVSLPFVVGGNLTDVEYGLGAFVNNASVDAGASTAIYTHALPELIRGRVHAALQSWTGALAAVTTIGAGCGATPFQQTALSLPRINSSVTYRGANAFPNTLSVLAIGFSDTHWGALTLPASLAAFGGPGCSAYCDVVASQTALANGTGTVNSSIALPNNPALITVDYYTQYYSFSGSQLRSSNALHSLVGL